MDGSNAGGGDSSGYANGAAGNREEEEEEEEVDSSYEDAVEELEQAIEQVSSDYVKETAVEQAIGDDAYEKILSSTPDTVRDVMKDIIVEKYVRGQLDEDDGTEAGAGIGAANTAANRIENGNENGKQDNSNTYQQLNQNADDTSDQILTRSASEVHLITPVHPEVSYASDINVPQGFRRDFVIANDFEDVEEVPEVVERSFIDLLLDSNSATLYAWIENDLDSDEEASDAESDDDDESMGGDGAQGRYGSRRNHMVFSTYGRRTRRMSDLANDQEHKADDRKTYFTLFKCFVATGIMFIPSGIANAGLVAGVCTILVIGALSLYGMLLLIETRTHLEQGRCATPSTPLLSSSAAAAVSTALFRPNPIIIHTYAQIGGETMGRTGKKLVEMSILFSQVGFCCVYISFIGNTLSQAIAKYHPGKDGLPLYVYMLCTIPVVTPLTFIRHLKYFAIPNLIANIFVFTSVFYVILQATYAIAHGDSSKNDWSCTSSEKDACFWFNALSYPMFLGTSCYTFEGISMVIPVQNSMKNPDHLPGMLKVVLGSVTIVFAIFGGVNLYAYGQDIKPIVIDNLPRDSGFVVTVMFVLVACFMFPLMSFPAARIIERKLFKKMRRSGFKWQKNFIRTCIVLFCVFVSVGAGEKVDKMVAIIGGLFCVPLALVYPPLFYLKSGCAYRFWAEKLPAAVLLTFGISAAILSTIIAIIQF